MSSETDLSPNQAIQNQRNVCIVNQKCYVIMLSIYRAIKLICNRVIHESEIVCRFLNKKRSLKHRLDLGISIEKTHGFKSMDDSITN
jgi:hypothetical protein